MADMSLLDTAKTAVAAVFVWLGGEGGRVIVAGGLGGLMRWLHSEKRRIQDGALAVVGGAVAARYLWPVPLRLMEVLTGPLELSPENTAMAAFLAGALGMSLVKVLTAVVETRAKAGGTNGIT